MIDSFFVPLCIAVASDEDTYCGTALIVRCTETAGLPPVALSTRWVWTNVAAGSQGIVWDIVHRYGMFSSEDPRQTAGLFKGGPGVPTQWAKRASWRGRLRAAQCV